MTMNEKPRPVSQPDARPLGSGAEPTRDQIRAGIEAQICPWCSAGPFMVLAGHTTRLHGVDKLQLRDLAGVTYSTPVCAPEVSDDRRESMRQPGRYVPTPPGRGYKKNPSRAAREQSRKTLAALRTDERTRAAVRAAHTPEVKAKRSATMSEIWSDRRGGDLEHGDHRKYATGCRCTECKAGHAEYFRGYNAYTTCGECDHDREAHNGHTHTGYCTVDDCKCRRLRNRRGSRRATS